MKLFVSLVLLLAVVGMAFGDVLSERRLSRPLVNLQQDALDQPRFLQNVARVILRFFAPSYGSVEPRYSIQVPVVPPPCVGVCVRVPIQALAQ